MRAPLRHMTVMILGIAGVGVLTAVGHAQEPTRRAPSEVRIKTSKEQATALERAQSELHIKRTGKEQAPMTLRRDTPHNTVIYEAPHNTQIVETVPGTSVPPIIAGPGRGSSLLPLLGLLGIPLFIAALHHGGDTDSTYQALPVTPAGPGTPTGPGTTPPTGPGTTPPTGPGTTPPTGPGTTPPTGPGTTPPTGPGTTPPTGPGTTPPTGPGTTPPVSTVPEPATLALFATGLAGIALARRRR